MFATILAEYWKPLALIALVAAALIYRTVIVKERDAARAQVAAITAQAQQLKAADDECVAAVGRQNAAVEKLQSDEQMAIKAADTREANVVADAETLAARAKTTADALAHAKLGAGCAAAIKWANQQAPALGKW